ncbi:A/G-specific adenine glycosylase [Denitromonas sp. IR12]|uniref:Adenine DNA glycosylase n=1 Tax=Denitromonas iodatirespirans TaxID=2795389 RepID=A0A944D851_DENI1|nr:A/G-specific adenine glycosylase [Denitromonas iodatirespirans]
MATFAPRLLDWHRHSGRHDLPWQNTRDPYRIWLSEIMLQQTQVDTVIPYYARFLAAFPDLAALAAAPMEAVMALWSGLGYYARARNLHACARTIMAEHGGRFPATAAEIATLPGIGRSTAAAIAAFSQGERAAILDGNVKRVLCRVFGIEGFPGSLPVEKQLWALAESLLPAARIGDYIQAQMDLGATVCVRGTPRCAACPLSDDCVAQRTGRERELPAARPRKRPPLRQARLAIIRRGAHVLLEQRPPKGIWGGLLGLPEVEGESVADWLMTRFGVCADIIAAEPLRHTFTHFVLDIHPQLVDLPVDTAAQLGAAQQWVPVGTLADQALPAPVRTLLSRYATPGGVSRSR